jgi:hypothetical protein
MELFVLLGDIDDQLECLGVYESREEARAQAKAYQATEKDTTIEGFVIERRQVGAAPKWGFLEDLREELEVDI